MQIIKQDQVTEKGLYMLATILKSSKAVKTTIAIIDNFAKVKELGHAIHQMQTLPENSPKQRSLKVIYE